MMLQNLRHSLGMARPRSLARMQKSLDDLVEAVRGLRRVVKEQNERDRALELRQQADAAAVASRIDELNARLHELSDQVMALTLRESQLRAIASADAALENALTELPAICDEQRIVAHVRQAIA